MYVEEFAEKQKTTKRTVKKWLEKGYIPGAYKNDEGIWIIPTNARSPYTSAKKCKGYSLYKSIVKAYSKGKNVVGDIYGISQEKLDLINQALLEQGLICKECLDGLTYYNTTAEGEKFISIRNTEGYKILLDTIVSVGMAAFNS